MQEEAEENSVYLYEAIAIMERTVSDTVAGLVGALNCQINYGFDADRCSRDYREGVEQGVTDALKCVNAALIAKSEELLGRADQPDERV